MSPPADAKRSPPGPGTATSKPLSAPPPAAENSEPSSRSNGQSSPPSGTCLAPAPTTKTQDRTTTAGTTPANAQLVPCETYEPSATRSPFTPSPWPTKPTSSPVSYQRDGRCVRPDPHTRRPAQRPVAVQRTGRVPVRGVHHAVD